MKPFLFLIALSAAAPVCAQYVAPVMPYSTHDSKSGNRYNVTPNYDGSVTVRGSNPRTGTMWRQQQYPDGSYRGTDSNGNMYRGNNVTGSYYNYGTGKSCLGKGYARRCY